MDDLDEQLLAIHAETQGKINRQGKRKICDESDSIREPDSDKRSSQPPQKTPRSESRETPSRFEGLCRGCEGSNHLCPKCDGMLEIQLGEGFTRDPCSKCGKYMHGDTFGDCECP